MKKRTQVLLIAGLILLFLLGAFLMIYPRLASWYYQKYGSEVQNNYVEQIEAVDTRELDKAMEAAREYNTALAEQTIDRLKPQENGYFDLLDLSGNGIMAYIRIPRINVSLPVYHGTSDAVLKAGAGHMPESSLPVGGTSTHTVITAHSGMATSPMFSDITLLEPGDIFYIDVLNQTLAYQILDESDIKVVDPQNVDDIQVTIGEDLCTLITCYPFGINTQRYLVRGHRIEQTEEIDETVPDQPVEPTEAPESVWESAWKQSVKTGLLIAVTVIISCSVTLLIVIYAQSHRKRGKYE